MKSLITSLVLVCAVLLAGAAVQADTIIYQQNFNSYSDGTPLTAVPGWYNWGAAVPTIIGGKAVVNNNPDMLLDMTDIFSYGNTQAKIEYDVVSYQQDDHFFAPGTASALDFNYGQFMGFEHGADRLYHANGGAFDYGYQVFVSNPLAAHLVFDLTKSGNQITWNSTYNGNPMWLGSDTFTLTDPRGLNTMEWYGLGSAGASIDNILITAVIVPEPGTLLLGMGVLGLLAYSWRRRS